MGWALPNHGGVFGDQVTTKQPKNFRIRDFLGSYRKQTMKRHRDIVYSHSDAKQAYSMTALAPQIQYINTCDLRFDPENPRFYRLEKVASNEEVIDEMLSEEGVKDLMISIGQKGYFSGEPLIATNENGYIEVIEGNRRLAAVKLLNGELAAPDHKTRGVKIILQEAIIPPPTTLPTIIYPTRSESLKYLGYRHITGVKEWDALSKAKYLEKLIDEFYSDIDEPAELKKILSKEIGSRPDYVGSLLRALHIYYKLKTNHFYGLNIEDRDVEFSLLTTAINYRSIAEWMNIPSPHTADVASINEDNLKKLAGWMFKPTASGSTVLGESRNLKELSSIVESVEAVTELEKSGDLDSAYLFSEGPIQALFSALNQAKKGLDLAWKMIPNLNEVEQPQHELAERLVTTSKDVAHALKGKLPE